MIRVFPVGAPTTLTNSYGEPRSGHPHAGNDLFADEGAPLLAVDDGMLRSGVDVQGGNIVNLYAADGARYYYAHLQAFAAPDGTPANSTGVLPPAPRQVRTGDVVGFLGRTGNAIRTQPHLHFEARPGNGPAIDPFPALAAAPRVQPNQSADPNARALRPGPLVTAVALGLVAASIWSYTNPGGVDRLVRRFG